MSKPLRILIAEDNPTDAELTVRALQRAGFDVDYSRVETEADYLQALDSCPDVVLSDYAMPQFSGPDALELLQKKGCEIPFIIVSGTIGEDVAVEMMRMGASDYLLKDRLGRIGQAITHALEESRMRTERKQARGELQFQKLLLEAQSEASIDGILTVDSDARIISCNQRFIEMWGISENILYGRTDHPVLQSAVHKIVDTDQFLERVRYLYAHPDIVSREEIVLKDGRVFDRYTAPVKGRDGTYYGRVWTFRDITEQRQAEAALRESDLRLRSITETARVGLVMVDGNHCYRYANSAYSDMFHLPEYIVGKRVADVLPEVYETQIRPRLERAFRGERLEYELQMPPLTPEEKHRYYAVTYQPGMDRSCSVVIVVISDITQRKHAEESLREREEQLRLHAEHSPAAVAMFNREMIYLVASRRWIEDYCIGENPIGRSHYEIFPELPQRWKEVHKRCLAGAVEKCEEDPFVRENGQTEWIRWETRPWHRADGEIGGIIIFSENITERKHAATEIEKQLDELRRWHDVMLGREERMLELKKEVNTLLAELKRPPRYTDSGPTP